MSGPNSLGRPREGDRRGVLGAIQPTAGAIDSQSVKTAKNGGNSGDDAGKKVKTRKRHIVTDTSGHLIALRVHAANAQARDGAPEVFCQLAREAPKLRHVFADGGYAGAKLRDALTSIGRWVMQIVKRSDTAKGLGENNRKRQDPGPHRPYQAHDKATRKSLKKFRSF